MIDNFYYGHMFGWSFGGVLMMLVFWAAIIFFVVWLVKEARSGSNSDSDISRSKSALDILKERYAKGEIDKREFEEKKNDLV